MTKQKILNDLSIAHKLPSLKAVWLLCRVVQRDAVTLRQDAGSDLRRCAFMLLQVQLQENTQTHQASHPTLIHDVTVDERLPSGVVMC